MLNLSIFIFVCLSVLFVALGIFAYMEDLRKRQSIVERAYGTGKSALRARRMTAKGWLANYFLNFFMKFGDSLKPTKAEELSKLKLDLIHAGFRQQNALEIFWGIKIGMGLAGLGVGLILALSALTHMQITMRFAIAVFVTAAFFYLPGIILNRRIDKRKLAIQKGLPDALDLLVVCVESGMGLDAAIHRVGQELQKKEPILCHELILLTLELRAGKSRREALKNLAMRIGLEDVNSLVAMLIQSDIFGTSIAQTLRVYAETMRTKRFQRAEEMAAKLPVKLLFPLVFFIFPTLLMVILGPSAIKLMSMFKTVNK